MTDEPGSQASEAEIPAGLHARGQALWVSLGQTLPGAPGQLALEICRTADRLDELDNVIAGKGVLQLMQFRTRNGGYWDSDGDHHVHIEVGFQSVLAEARQQQSTFKALLVDLGKLVDLGPPAGVPQPAAPRSPLDELAQRRTQEGRT